jgi:hypothetical protein
VSLLHHDPDQQWREDAACVPATVLNPDLASTWTDEKSPLREYAENICAECPVRQLCALDAIQDDEAEGLRGGFYFSRGRVPYSEGRKMHRALGIIPRTRQHTRKRQAFTVED